MLIEIPREFVKQAGKADKGTRIFRRRGSHAEMTAWLEDMCKYIGPCVSPGTAVAYVAVTRAGVHKRLNTGRLTAFSFDVVGQTEMFYGEAKKLKELAMMLIPFSECRAWREELATRTERAEKNGGSSGVWTRRKRSQKQGRAK
jgi:hypothetical protein